MSHRFDKQALPLADVHYSRQKPGTPQFVAPGRCVVFVVGDPVVALWVSSWPFAEFTKHAWAGAWINTLFRNERRQGGLSSELINEAVAATIAEWGKPPPLGFVSFVDSKKIASVNPGCCYKAAGWKFVGYTETKKQHAFQLLPDAMPQADAAPDYAIGAQVALFR